LDTNSPSATSGQPNQSPSTAFPFGTDNQGHDLLSQFIWGARPSLTIALEAALGAALMGFVVGILGGYYNRLEGVLSILTDIVLTFPVLVIIIILASLFQPTDLLLAIFLMIFLWAPVSRAVRAQVLSVKKRAYVQTAKMSGVSDFGIAFKVIAPEVASLAVSYFIIDVSVSVILVTSLEFLGVGNANIISWGSILYWAQQFAFAYKDWWWIVEPGIMISLVAFGLALIGFTVVEVMNPRLRVEA
jgi:peptide/nickel transport system permease protein